MGEMKLISSSGENNVNRQKVGAVTTSDCHILEETRARNTHLYHNFFFFKISNAQYFS